MVAALAMILFAAPATAQGQAPAPPGPPQGAGPVEFTYDGQRGRVEVIVHIDPAQGQYFGARYQFTIGRELRDGTCVVGRPGDLKVDLTVVWDISYGTAAIVGGGRVGTVSSGGGVTEAFPRYTFPFAGRALVGRGYRCIGDLVIDGSSASPQATSASIDSDPATDSPMLAGASTLTFAGDFETGLVPPWTSIQRVSADRFRLDTARIREPSQSARVEIRGGDPLLYTGQRSEILWGGDNGLTLHPGDHYYFGWSTWFDSAFPSPGTTSSNSDTGHCIFIQWKDYQTGGPPIDLGCRQDRIQIGYTPKCGGWNIPLERAGWNDFVVRVLFSDTNGEIEIWHRAPGETSLTRKLTTCVLPTLRTGEDSYLKLGYYRRDDEINTGVLWHDGMRVGSTLEAVAPPAVGTPAAPDTTAPSTPAGLTATASAHDAIDLSWTASTDDVGVARYHVYEGTTLVGTTTTSAFKVTGLAAQSTHAYAVTALDAAGNESPRSAEASATTPAAPVATRTVTVVAESDTMVKQAQPTSSFGSAKTLLVDTQAGTTANTAIHSYLRFNVPALAAGETVTEAGLKLRVSNATPDGPAIFRTSNTSTAAAMEKITWNSGRPARLDATPVGNFAGMTVSNASHSTAVSGITGSGVVTFELTPESADDLGFGARNDSSANRPVLILTVRSGG